jgi:hypothetical protein
MYMATNMLRIIMVRTGMELSTRFIHNSMIRIMSCMCCTTSYIVRSTNFTTPIHIIAALQELSWFPGGADQSHRYRAAPSVHARELSGADKQGF